MPGSPSRRFDSCNLPPKKFAWRINNDNNHSATNCNSPLKETENSVKQEEEHKMGFILKNEGYSSPPPSQNSRAVEVISPAVSEDAPLDFSVRRCLPGPSNRSVNPTDSPFSNGTVQEPSSRIYTDMLKQLQSKSSTSFPGMSNGRHSPPGTSNNIWSSEVDQLDDDVITFNGKRKSPKRESSESPSEHLSGSVQTGLNGSFNDAFKGGLFLKNSSARLQSFLDQEDSSVNESPILHGMLKAREHVGKDMPKIISKLHSVNILNGNLANSSEGASALIPTTTTAAHHISHHTLPPVNNIVPVAAVPFYTGMSYVPQSVGSLSGGILPQGSEASALQALATRKQKKKKHDERPFKSYPMDALSEKLQSVSANAYVFGLEYSKQLMSRSFLSSSPPSDPGRTAPVNESPERVNGAINPNNSRAETVVTANNPQCMHASGDSNDDSLPSVSPDPGEGTSGTNGHKRKSTAEADKDEAYWDRRKKNNLAAKRSREARRRKEDAIANMAVILEAQNTDLKSHLSALNYSYSDVLAQLTRLSQEYEALKIQNNILQERLAQKRCGQCGAKLPSVN